MYSTFFEGCMAFVCFSVLVVQYFNPFMITGTSLGWWQGCMCCWMTRGRWFSSTSCVSCFLRRLSLSLTGWRPVTCLEEIPATLLLLLLLPSLSGMTPGETTYLNLLVCWRINVVACCVCIAKPFLVSLAHLLSVFLFVLCLSVSLFLCVYLSVSLSVLYCRREKLHTSSLASCT